jgi:hypothetical protein
MRGTIRTELIREQELESLVGHSSHGRRRSKVGTADKIRAELMRQKVGSPSGAVAHGLASIVALAATVTLGCLVLAIGAAVAFLAMTAAHAVAACLVALFLFAFDLYRIARRRIARNLSPSGVR